MKSIRTKIIMGILFCSLLTAGIIACLAIVNSSQMASVDTAAKSQLSGEVFAGEINSTISRIEQSVNTLSDAVMQDFDYAAFKKSKDYADQYTKQIEKEAVNFASHTDGAVTAYVRYNPQYSNPTSGIFMSRNSTDENFTLLTPTDFSMYDASDVAHVGWYYQPVEAGEPLWMEPYLNENVNIYMISYVIPLYAEDGTSIGVVGMDIDFGTLTDLTDAISMYDTGYAFLINAQGVVMHHKNDVAIAGNVMKGTQMKPGNVEIIPMPLNHSFGIRRYQSDMIGGGTVCLMNGMAMIGNLWRMLEQYHATSMAISPATLGMIFHLSDDRIAGYADQIDYIQVGSAPLPETDKEKLLRYLPRTRLYNFYGSSEAGCSCILEFSRQNKNGCIGYPTVNSLVRFIDEEGDVIENGSEKQPALLAWGGPIVMEGYYNDPELTAKTVVDGYVMTNDLGYMDEDGSIILVGRADDVINYGGSKISPAEVETVAIRYPGVADCAYSSVQDPITGELPVMLIVQEDEFDETAFQSYMQQQVESYKLPQKIFYIEKVPKTFKGSLLRKEIKKIAESKNKGE